MMLLFAFSTLVNTARIVTPGIGTLLLSSTMPEIVVLAVSPGARPEAVKAAGKPVLVARVVWPRLVALPSWMLTGRVAVAPPWGAVFPGRVGGPGKLPPPSFPVMGGVAIFGAQPPFATNTTSKGRAAA